jgi:hypothetical protein
MQELHPAWVDILRLEVGWKEVRMSSIEVRAREREAGLSDAKTKGRVGPGKVAG